MQYLIFLIRLKYNNTHNIYAKSESIFIYSRPHIFFPFLYIYYVHIIYTIYVYIVCTILDDDNTTKQDEFEIEM